MTKMTRFLISALIGGAAVGGLVVLAARQRHVTFAAELVKHRGAIAVIALVVAIAVYELWAHQAKRRRRLAPVPQRRHSSASGTGWW
jgi:membrane protein DedA with SNARE-associated domain